MVRETLFVAFAIFAISIIASGCEKKTPFEPNSKPAPAIEQPSDPLPSDSPNPKPPGIVSPPVDSSLPLADKYTETIPKTLVEFEMILVPADESNGKDPFYIGKTEVTWEEFDYWALCLDIKEKKAILEREKMLRPSAPHDVGAIYRNWGREGQPAVGVSRLSAQRYCDWLSNQTGKKYRLPTSDEWDYAFQAGGGTLNAIQTPEELKKIAWFEENSLDTEETFTNRAMGVAQLAANKLGVHDMLGNASEWVTDTGDDKVARGGHFLTSSQDLTGENRVVEDQAVWNKNYPQGNTSLWWYVDADFVGFRLICEQD